MKTIVTHFAPDVDAVSSVWLLKRFLAGWSEAEVKFVAAGKTLDNDIVDSDPNILHVDTGMGILDHHQTDEDTCAAKRTLDYISSEIRNSKLEIRTRNVSKFPDEALERLVDVVNDIDHFREVYYPNPSADFYDFGLVAILDGLRLIFKDENSKIVDFGLIGLDGIYKGFQNKVWAAEELLQGVEFKTKKGKGVGVETINDDTVKVAQKNGYTIAIRKDPKKGFVRIKTLPDSSIDLTKCYNILKVKDSEATWFLHASKKMLLNGSVKNPDSKPTSLSLKEVIEVLKENI